MVVLSDRNPFFVRCWLGAVRPFFFPTGWEASPSVGGSARGQSSRPIVGEPFFRVGAPPGEA